MFVCVLQGVCLMCDGGRRGECYLRAGGRVWPGHQLHLQHARGRAGTQTSYQNILVALDMKSYTQQRSKQCFDQPTK